jgi:LmbE family N-acetylglucosaminyl deacetylase
MFGKRVLVLIPHPDDELVGTATAIERLRHSGGDALGLYLTSGVPSNSGSWWGGRPRYDRRVARRWAEASEVARELGLTIIDHQSIPSRELKSHLATSIRWIRNHVSALRPDRIWVPAYEGGHQDHDVTNFIGAQLSEDCEVWEFAEYNFFAGKIQSQTFAHPNGTESILMLEDDETARKMELLLRYASERKNLGYIGVERESLRPLAAYDYRRRPHVGRCFYERFHWVPFHPRIDYGRPEEVCAALRNFA